MQRPYAAAVALLLAGCATSAEITAWNMAREVNTPAAYEDFVRRYPQSDKAEEARALIEKAKEEKIKKAATVAEAVRAAEGIKDTRTVSLAADAAFEAAKRETSPDALYLFLETFKGHPGAAAVRERIEDLEFEAAAKADSSAALRHFLYRWPSSRRAAQARELLADRAYREAKAWNSPYGYEAFALSFPGDPRAAGARALAASVARPPGPAPGGAALTLAEAVKRVPSLRDHACALALSAALARGEGDADELRRTLRRIEKGEALGEPPPVCASAELGARAGAERAVAELLGVLALLEEQRKELAGRWEVLRQREEMAKAAAAASSSVANELETAELSEEVLGTGPLGRLEVGAEKGSRSARRAFDLFGATQEAIRRDKERIRGLLAEVEAAWRPLQACVAALVETKGAGEAKR